MAVNGSSVLHELDRGLNALRQEVHSMDTVIASSGARMREFSNAQLELYRKLAELRLAEFERGEIVSSIDAVAQDVAAMLERRDAAYRELLDAIAAQETELETLETQREQLRVDAEAAARALDDAEASVQASLNNDSDYQQQLEKTREADAIADEAEAKTQDARDDQLNKGKPFESDRLFMYLWRRKYGTAQYSANPLARLLDRWVAGLCDYDKARPNYWMLNEIPLRLQAHAEAARAGADTEFERLKQLEAEAGAGAGLPQLNSALDAQEDALESCDASIAAVEDRIAELGDQHAQYAAGRDQRMLRALDTIATELRSAGIDKLRRRAAVTPSRDDDRIVDDIADLDRRIEVFEQEHRDRQKISRRQADKLRDLGTVRQQFKRRGYDDMRSVFSDNAAVTTGLQQFLSGLLDHDDLWRIITRAQHFRRARARPRHGSGGIGHRPGTWRLPRPSSNRRPRIGTGGGFRFPSGGGGGLRFPSGGGRRRRSGGGGFKTGGGF